MPKIDVVRAVIWSSSTADFVQCNRRPWSSLLENTNWGHTSAWIVPLVQPELKIQMFLWEIILLGNKKDCEINLRGWVVSDLVLSRSETLHFKLFFFYLYLGSITPDMDVTATDIFFVKCKVLKDRSNSNTINPSRQNDMKTTPHPPPPRLIFFLHWSWDACTGMFWVLLVYTGTIPPSLAGKICVTCSGPQYLRFINSVWKELFHRAQTLLDLSVKPEAWESNFFPGKIGMDGCTVTKGVEGFEKASFQMEWFFLWFKRAVGS